MSDEKPTNSDPAIEVLGPSQTLKKLSKEMAWLSVMAVASIVLSFLPGIAEITIPMLPDNIEVMIGPLVMSGILSFRVWALSKIKTLHKVEQKAALEAPPPNGAFPPELDRFYKR